VRAADPCHAGTVGQLERGIALLDSAHPKAVICELLLLAGTVISQTDRQAVARLNGLGFQ